MRKGTERGQELIEMSRKRSERGMNRKSHAVFDDFVTFVNEKKKTPAKK